MKKTLSFLLLMALGIVANAQTVALSISQAPCNANGIVTATLSGFTDPVTVTYQWGFTGNVVHTGVTGSTDALNNWMGQTINVTVIDANNVSGQAGLPGQPPFIVDVTTTPAYCPAPGTATAVITGGTAPYTYSFTNTGNVVLSTTNPASLPGGNYNVMVTDANGCTYGTGIVDSGFFIEYVSPFGVSVTSTNASCTNGTANTITPTGGTAPYTYVWSNGATGLAISGLTSGSYYCTATDANGCSATGYTYVNQTPQITVNMTPTPATCLQNDGAITAFGSGGTAPYTYQYDNGATTGTQTNIPAGTYQVIATDVNGCIGHGYGYVSSTTPITVTYTSTPSSCTAPTGTATVAISGGQTPYTTTWSTFPAQSGITATNLAPGDYTFHITDANGCVRTGQAHVPPIDVISGNVSTSDATCIQSNGIATVSVSGGVAPYTYLWNTGATTVSINGLTSGGYSVLVTDANSCIVTKTGYVYSYSPVHLGLSATDASCLYVSDGTVTANAWGGTAPYTYNGQSSNVITGLATQQYYYVNVTDANGCTATKHTQIGYNAANNSCYCTISGTVYNDLNGNCTQDVGEAGIQNIQMHLDGFGYTYTDPNGVYSFKAPTGSYTLSESVLAFYPLAACQNNTVPVTAVAATNCSQSFNFANVINPIHDIHVSTWNYSHPIPGFNYQMISVTSNDGTVTEPAIQMGYNTDGQIGSPTYITGGLLTGGPTNYDATAFPTLAPGDNQYIYYDYVVPPNIPLNTSLLFKDSVAYTAPMSNWMNDYSPWNNVDYFTTTTVGSFDPNFKEVNPKGTGPDGNITYSDSVLEYMVHFQNVGTYFAQNVVVLDTLDSDLDWSTLRPVYQSFPCKVNISDDGVASFNFNNINLPAKQSDAMGSNGLFTYTVHTKHNLPIGTQFKNSASIYFDYNAPVVTNTTVNTLAFPEAVATVSAGSISNAVLSPNPTTGSFNIRATLNGKGDEKAHFDILDITGRTISANTTMLHNGEMNQNVTLPANIANGVYLVHITGNGQSSVLRFVLNR